MNLNDFAEGLNKLPSKVFQLLEQSADPTFAEQDCKIGHLLFFQQQEQAEHDGDKQIQTPFADIGQRTEQEVKTIVDISR
ncbi:hypothetical protein D3C81_1842750 [compost metagenome]